MAGPTFDIRSASHLRLHLCGSPLDGTGYNFHIRFGPSNGRFTSELGSDQSVWLVLILLLGTVRTWLFPQPLQGHVVINGFWPMLMLASAGTLFAIPTAAEIQSYRP